MDKILFMILFLALSFFLAFFGLLIIFSNDFATTVTLTLYSKRLFYGLAMILGSVYCFFISMKLKYRLYQQQETQEKEN